MIKIVEGQYTIEIEIGRNKSITVTREGHAPIHFKIGSEAEYDSWNLSYTGIIKSITEKTVTIEAYPGTQNARRHRLKLATFAWRNYNFDSVRIAAENFDTMQYI